MCNVLLLCRQSSQTDQSNVGRVPSSSSQHLRMGNNAKKKVRSLPPLGKERSRGRRKTEVRVKERVVSVSRELCQAPAGLDVQLPDRQRLIGSPAPQSFRNKLHERHKFKKVPSE